MTNQHRAAFTTLRHQNHPYWKPLFNWLLNIGLVNSYLLAKVSGLVIGRPRCHRRHRQFQEALVKTLMVYHEIPEHNQIRRPTRAYYAFCRKHQLHWQPKYQRSFGANITNIVSRFQGSSTQWGCDSCNIPLCKIGNCWRLWHEKFN